MKQTAAESAAGVDADSACAAVGWTDGRLLVAVLAAGASTRLGRAKQLVAIAEEPLLRRQCRVALDAKIGRVAVVLGCHADTCAASISDLPVSLLVNLQWHAGLGQSIRIAAEAASATDAHGLLLMHVDQYRLTPLDLRSLREVWLESNFTAACIANHGDDIGPPVIFPRSRFGELQQLDGDRGARRIVAEMPLEIVRRVEMPNAIYDLDSPAQLAEAEQWANTWRARGHISILIRQPI